MHDRDPWDGRFLGALTEALPAAPPAAAYLYRRAVIARVQPRAGRVALIVAVAEVLREDGYSQAQVLGTLRGALAAAPTALETDALWEAGRGDLMPLVGAHPARRCVMARLALPVIAALAVGALALHH